MKKLGIAAVGIMLILTVFISGCVTDEDKVAIGTLQLRITDKPAELEIIHANVTISTVQVHKSGADDEGEETGFIADAHGEYQGIIGVDIQFFGNASGGEEPYTWSWDFGDGNISDEQNPMHNYSVNGTYDVGLTVTDNNSATAIDTTIATIGENTNEDDTSNAGWFTIVNESQTFDLIQLQNVTELLGEKNLSTGKYTQIRLTVESATITINNSGQYEEYTLNISSNKIKLIKPFWITEDETTVLTLDFDIYKSVHQTGSNKFIMNPTIKVIEG